MRALCRGSHTPSACFTGSAFPCPTLSKGTLTEALPLAREHSEHRKEGVTHRAGATHSSGLSGSVMQMRT